MLAGFKPELHPPPAGRLAAPKVADKVLYRPLADAYVPRSVWMEQLEYGVESKDNC